jgi:hypothetical protein
MRGRASPGCDPLAEVSAFRSRRALRARRVVPPRADPASPRRRRSGRGRDGGDLDDAWPSSSNRGCGRASETVPSSGRDVIAGSAHIPSMPTELSTLPLAAIHARRLRSMGRSPQRRAAIAFDVVVADIRGPPEPTRGLTGPSGGSARTAPPRDSALDEPAGRREGRCDSAGATCCAKRPGATSASFPRSGGCSEPPLLFDRRTRSSSACSTGALHPTDCTAPPSSRTDNRCCWSSSERERDQRPRGLALGQGSRHLGRRLAQAGQPGARYRLG